MDGEQRQQLESILDNMNKEKINESQTPPAASSPPQNQADPWPPRSDRKDRDRRNSGKFKFCCKSNFIDLESIRPTSGFPLSDRKSKKFIH